MSDNTTTANSNAKDVEVYGRIVVIKRTGQDSASFELMDDSYTFGRAIDCDIRIQLASIAEQHCKIIRNEFGQAVLVKLSEDGIFVNNLGLKEESRVLEHNDIFTLIERSFRYEFTPEMLIKAQLASAHVSDCLTGTIPLSMETPKKPSSLSASVFSISEVPSSPATPKTPVPALRVNSNNVSNGQSPRVVASPMGSNVVDNEITTSPKLSPKVFKLESEVLGSVSPFNIVGASSLGMNVVSSTDGHAECDKENSMPEEHVENVTIAEKTADKVESYDNVESAATDNIEAMIITEVDSESLCASIVESVAESTMDAEIVYETADNFEAVSETVVHGVRADCETETAEIGADDVLDDSETSEITEGSVDDVHSVETACEPLEDDGGCADIFMKSANVAENVQVSEVAETATEDVIMSEVTGNAGEAVAETTEIEAVTGSEIVIEKVTESNNNIHACEADAKTADSVVETIEFMEAIESSIEAVVSIKSVDLNSFIENVEACGPIAEIAEHVSEDAELLIGTNEVFRSEMGVNEAVVEVYENTSEVAETAKVDDSSESHVADSFMGCESVLENASEAVERVVEEATVVLEDTEITGEELSTVFYVLDSIEQTDKAVVDGQVAEEVMIEKNAAATFEYVETVGVAAEIVEDDGVSEGTGVDFPVETLIPEISETVQVSEPKTSAESFVNADGTDIVETITEISEDAESSVYSAPVISAPIESVEEMAAVESAENSVTSTHVDDNLEISIDPLEDVVVEISGVNQEMCSIEMASVEIAAVEIPVSPDRKESEEFESNTPGPQRKSTRVHVTPKALESVKKQDFGAGESGNKRALRSTGRQLRSRVGAEPDSPKGRNQKRSAVGSEEDENVDPASVSLFLSVSDDNNKKSKTKSSASESDNTPVRRSTRSRVQK